MLGRGVGLWGLQAKESWVQFIIILWCCNVWVKVFSDGNCTCAELQTSVHCHIISPKIWELGGEREEGGLICTPPHSHTQHAHTQHPRTHATPTHAHIHTHTSTSCQYYTTELYTTNDHHPSKSTYIHSCHAQYVWITIRTLIDYAILYFAL